MRRNLLSSDLELMNLSITRIYQEMAEQGLHGAVCATPSVVVEAVLPVVIIQIVTVDCVSQADWVCFARFVDV